jgi:hypothetical protein
MSDRVKSPPLLINEREREGDPEQRWRHGGGRRQQRAIPISWGCAARERESGGAAGVGRGGQMRGSSSSTAAGRQPQRRVSSK